MRKLLLVLLIAEACTSSAAAAEPAAQRFSLSVYSAAGANGDGLFTAAGPDNGAPGGYAIVRDRRSFDLHGGRDIVEVQNLSRWLDAAALTVRPVGETAATIIGQRFEDEPLSLDALVQKRLGHGVEVVTGSQANPVTISGTLLSNTGGIIVRQADGRVVTITDYSRITFPDLPHGLSATPTLRLDIEAKRAGPQAFDVVYPTQGMAWRAEYGGWISGADCRLALAGWAQIANRTGSDFPDARVKLIAGEPHRASTAPAPRVMMVRGAAAATLQAEATGYAGDYHEYTLDSTVDLGSGTLLRAALFAEHDLPCQRQYVFEGTSVRANPGMAPITDRNYGLAASEPVRSTVSFKSDRALPAGRVRVLQDATDGMPEFIGEDDLEHTPRGQQVAIDLGNAFDLRGEREQADYQLDKERRSVTESFTIRIANGGATAKTVVAREHLYRWSQWNITQASAKYVKRNADTIEFTLDVPANGDASVSYTVQYQWRESLK